MTGRLRGALAAVPLLLALPLAGCGPDGGSGGVASAGGRSGAATTPAASLSPEQLALKFTQCMREHGVDMPDPDPANPGRIQLGGNNVDQSKVSAAMEACREFAPIGNGTGRLDPAQAENVRKFAKCMRENGVPNFPDPDGGLIRVDASVGQDPDFPAAQRKCQQLYLPNATTGTR